MNSSTISSDLSKDISDYLESVPPVTDDMLEELADANRILQGDPSFEADVIKMVFVNEMLEALASRGETKAKLAARLGKSRQSIQKLFDEDNRENFTIDTMCELAYALDRRVHLHVCKQNEAPMILTAARTPEAYSEKSWVERVSKPLTIKQLGEFKEISYSGDRTYAEFNAA
jgi:transcriptional regulator with XRE-family HTH domain